MNQAFFKRPVQHAKLLNQQHAYKIFTYALEISGPALVSGLRKICQFDRPNKRDRSPKKKLKFGILHIN